jgi:hypothetical protein
LLDALVPPAVAAAGVADRSAGGPDFGWDLVTLGDDRSALGGVIGLPSTSRSW